jgi:hypothetical protein
MQAVVGHFSLGGKEFLYLNYGEYRMSRIEDSKTESDAMPVGREAVLSIVAELEDLGMVAYEFRTGVDVADFTDDSLWKPIIGVCATTAEEAHHLFTIAAMAGWQSEYALNGKGVLLAFRAANAEEALGGWAMLLNSARLVRREIGSK